MEFNLLLFLKRVLIVKKDFDENLKLFNSSKKEKISKRKETERQNNSIFN
jgi:hypothetical protein